VTPDDLDYLGRAYVRAYLPPGPPSRLDAVVSDYVAERIDVETLEREVGALLAECSDGLPSIDTPAERQIARLYRARSV
jgi:hypothetical protein